MAYEKRNGGKRMSKFDYPFCEVCAEELNFFVDATKYARGVGLDSDDAVATSVCTEARFKHLESFYCVNSKTYIIIGRKIY